MTEKEWEKCLNPYTLLKYVDKRKVRLFCCAWIRKTRKNLDFATKMTLDIVERYADGLLTDEQLDEERKGVFNNVDARNYSFYTSTIHLLDSDDAYWFLSEGGFSHDMAKARLQLIKEEIVGNPCKTYLLSPSDTSLAIAKAIYQEKDWGYLPILADSLEDDGCQEQDILFHLREKREHYLGCWALDRVLN